MTAYWLMKSEPEDFSIDDLERERVEPWSGVRSVFARFQMRQMRVGDEVLFHHSSCDPPGVAGLARVVRTGVVDETQFDPESKYFDDSVTRAAPKWDCVEVEFVRKLANFVPIERMRGDPALADMLLLKRGMRLSVQPVTEAQYRRVVELAETAWEPPPKPPRPKPPKRATNGKAKAKKARKAKPEPRPKARAGTKRPARRRARA